MNKEKFNLDTHSKHRRVSLLLMAILLLISVEFVQAHREAGDLTLLNKINGNRLQLAENGSLNISTLTQSHLFVSENGNVGIGTDALEYKLYIDGKIRIQNGWRGLIIEGSGTNPHRYDFIIGELGGAELNYGGFGIFEDTENSYRFTISRTGNIGIGTINPSR
ncbi:MAG: hypothetical protein U9N51_10565 [Bacteroidota bacterium]|nr:hypothetical protein [Bacteroidota bacterium]